MRSDKNRTIVAICIPLSIFVVFLKGGIFGLLIIWLVAGIKMYINHQEMKEYYGKREANNQFISYVQPRYEKKSAPTAAEIELERQRRMKEWKRVSGLLSEGKISWEEYEVLKTRAMKGAF